MFAVGAELGHVVDDPVVELEATALPLLRDGHRDARLGHREPDDHRLGRHGHTDARFADPEVGDRLAADRHVHLGAEVEPSLHALADHADRAADCVRARALDSPVRHGDDASPLHPDTAPRAWAMMSADGTSC